MMILHHSDMVRYLGLTRWRRGGSARAPSSYQTGFHPCPN